MRVPSSVQAATAHLIGPGKLKCSNGRLTFARPGESPFRLDVKHLSTVLCYGGVTFSDEAVHTLLKKQIVCCVLDRNGSKCLGRIQADNPSTTLLRVGQVRAFDNSSVRLEIAAMIVRDKIQSQSVAARHFQRHGLSMAGQVCAHLRYLSERIDRTDSLEELRGLEGAASLTWFSALRELLPADWGFRSRQRRPPTDPANSLLSLGYTFLVNRVTAAIVVAGLEPNLGFLHEFRAGRPSLACDLMEPFRVPAVDRWVVSVAGRRMLSPAEFESRDGGVYLPKEKFGDVLHHWEEYWGRSNLEMLVTNLIGKLSVRCRE